MTHRSNPKQNEELDIVFMQAALQEAQKAAACNEVPIGAVVVAQSQIIARAHNQVEQLNDPTAHAEMMAITAATTHLQNKYLNHCTLYVTLEPCPMCSGALFWAQLKRLVFGTTDPNKGYQTFKPNLLHPKTEVTSHILSQESCSLLTGFFKQRRKIILQP